MKPHERRATDRGQPRGYVDMLAFPFQKFAENDRADLILALGKAASKVDADYFCDLIEGAVNTLLREAYAQQLLPTPTTIARELRHRADAVDAFIEIFFADDPVGSHIPSALTEAAFLLLHRDDEQSLFTDDLRSKLDRMAEFARHEAEIEEKKATKSKYGLEKYDYLALQIVEALSYYDIPLVLPGNEFANEAPQRSLYYRLFLTTLRISTKLMREASHRGQPGAVKAAEFTEKVAGRSPKTILKQLREAKRRYLGDAQDHLDGYSQAIKIAPFDPS